MAIFSAFISLVLFLMMQATIELPQHAEKQDIFSDNTLMGRSYLITAKEEVTNKAPDFIFDPNISITHYYMICLCEAISIKHPLHALNFKNNPIIRRSDIYL